MPGGKKFLQMAFLNRFKQNEVKECPGINHSTLFSDLLRFSWNAPCFMEQKSTADEEKSHKHKDE